ncbi:hypothetical protein MTYM_01986 [Methylococcales bacterium]|nr:hypothetical protein MTYM_01986 [Methylococcales bacterium]
MACRAIQYKPKDRLIPSLLTVKPRLWALAAATALTFAPTGAYAGPVRVDGFTGYYALSNWNKSYVGSPGGSVTYDPTDPENLPSSTNPNGVINKIMITGKIDSAGRFYFTITAAPGTWSFHYDYSTSWQFYPPVEEAGFISSSTPPGGIFLVNSDSAFSQRDVASTVLASSPTIGFYVSSDFAGLTTVFTINQFTAMAPETGPGPGPTPTSEPAALWLFASGLLGIPLARRRNSNV